MKKHLSLIAVVGCLALLCGAAMAGSVKGTMRIEVPFAFTVGDYTLPAGEYFVRIGRLTRESDPGSSVVLTRIADGTDFAFPAFPFEATPVRWEAKMVFHKYGAKHFLANVETNGMKSILYRTAAEKDLIAKASDGLPKTSVAD